MACGAGLAALLAGCGAALPTTPRMLTEAPVATVPPTPVATVPPTPVAWTQTASAIGTPTPTATVPPTSIPPVRWAAIGDYGLAGEPAAAVAALVKRWEPEWVVTAGDNNYPAGAADTIDANIGQYYHEFIQPYNGSYGQGSSANRFFPALGNHDWQTERAQPYFDYFTLPGNERYYAFGYGSARFFMLNSNPDEPDGVNADSVQAGWLRQNLAASDAAWKIVVMHHAPYSSGHHGSSGWMRWPYAEWGAHLVIAGHDHCYERIMRDGIVYLVNGLGGAARYARGIEQAPGSAVFFNAAHGALLAEMSVTTLNLRFTTIDGDTIDSYAFQ